MAGPRFSIVIPTRNRAHVLPYALRSALAQTHDNFEVVVMANSPRDNTKQVVADMADPRIKYFESGAPLNMSDNWDLAWTKATGDYLIYLCDDDSLVPEALELIERELQDDPPVVTWQDAIYYYPDYHNADVRNILLLFHYNQALVENKPTEVMQAACEDFTFGWNDPMPRMANTAANRAFFEPWREKFGHLFFPMAPDYSFVWIATHVASNVRVLHRPLTLHGVSDHGTGLGLGKEGLRFRNEFAADILDGLPTEIPLASTNVAATFNLTSKSMEPYGFAPPSMNWRGYFISLAEQLLAAKPETEDWPPYVDEVKRAVARDYPELAEQVNEILSRDSFFGTSTETIRELRDRTRKMASEWDGSLADRAKEYAGEEACAACTLGMNPAVLAQTDFNNIYVFGEEAGFSDPFGAAAVTTRYYDMLRHCNERRRTSRAGSSR